MHRKIISNI